jgi:hypothetical protein
MREFTKENLPKRDKSVRRLMPCIYVLKLSTGEYYACKKAQNRGVFIDACKNISKYNKGREEAEKVLKFESQEATLNYLNNVKTKDFKKKLEKLAVDQQKEIIEQIKERPNMIFGVQKSLLKGFSDLPLFKSASDARQKDLF